MDPCASIYNELTHKLIGGFAGLSMVMLYFMGRIWDLIKPIRAFEH